MELANIYNKLSNGIYVPPLDFKSKQTDNILKSLALYLNQMIIETNTQPSDLKSYPGGEINDAVPWMGLNCYNYSVGDATKDFSVKL